MTQQSLITQYVTHFSHSEKSYLIHITSVVMPANFMLLDTKAFINVSERFGFENSLKYLHMHLRIQ